MGISVQDFADTVFTSSASKLKGSGIYTYKKQSCTLNNVESGDQLIKFVAINSKDKEVSLFEGVLNLHKEVSERSER